jgi:hypothetical protein
LCTKSVLTSWGGKAVFFLLLIFTLVSYILISNLISSSARIAINLAERKNDDPFPLNAPLFTAKMINGYGLDQALADFSVLANMRYASPADFSFGNDKFKCFIFGGKLMVHTLIVEDDSHIRKIMSLYLKKEGFNIVEASNGHEPLVKINSHPIDLVY